MSSATKQHRTSTWSQVTRCNPWCFFRRHQRRVQPSKATGGDFCGWIFLAASGRHLGLDVWAHEYVRHLRGAFLNGKEFRQRVFKTVWTKRRDVLLWKGNIDWNYQELWGFWVVEVSRQSNWVLMLGSLFGVWVSTDWKLLNMVGENGFMFMTKVEHCADNWRLISFDAFPPKGYCLLLHWVSFFPH